MTVVPGLLVNGLWHEGSGDEVLEVRSPYSGELVGEVRESSIEDVDAAIASAAKAFSSSPLAPYERAGILRRASELIEQRSEQFARSIVAEAGKPIRDARAEVSRAVLTFEACAEEATRIAGEYVPVEATPGSENRRALTFPRAAGVVCAITPFNGPVNQLSHKVPTAIAAGCTVVVKPAEATPLSAIMVAQALIDAGLPPGHVAMVQGKGETVGQWLLEDPRFSVYSFTGSTAVGLHIRRTVGLRKTLLELGNNSANIVNADADIDLAARSLTRSLSVYAGQVCISAQRILVHDQIFERFARALVEKVEALRVGDPSDEDTEVGPMVTEEAAVRAESWIQEAIASGADLLCGGERKGAFLEPTLLAEPAATSNILCSEAFAPVAALLRFSTLTEAIKVANDTDYGLQAGVFTNDINAAWALAEGLEVGGVIVNDASSYRVDTMPYGGIKQSGTGREGVRYAIDHMTNFRLLVFNREIPR